MVTIREFGINVAWRMRAIAPVAAAIAWVSSPVLVQAIPVGRGETRVNTNSGLVIDGLPIDALIEGGDRRGRANNTNVFHRFREFNINQSERVYFDGSGTDNILSRVSNPLGESSRIFGTLGVFGGNANLFLLDPNGIVFGPNSRLDLQGSFFASTADDIRLRNGVRAFESLESDITTDDLTVRPGAFLFNQLRPDRGDIQVGTLPPDLENPDRGLSVADGQSLILLGSDIDVDGGYLRAPGGRIQLGAVAETPGNRVVRLRFVPDVREFRLSASDQVEFADITLENGAIIDVAIADESGRDGGNIVLSGENIGILSGSSLCAGVGVAEACNGNENIRAGSRATRPGNILIEASDTVTIRGASTRIGNNISPEGQIDPGADIFEAIEMLDDPDTEEPIDVLFGSILIFGSDVDIRSGAQVTTSTSGVGSAGVVFISADNTVSLDAALSPEGSSTGLFSNVRAGGNGNAGGILIVAGSNYSQTNGALIMSDVSADGRMAGNVDITAPEIFLNNSSAISTSVFGANASRAGTVNLSGERVVLDNGSNIFNNVERNSSNSFAGTVNISAPGSLILSNGSQIQTIIRGNDPDNPDNLPAAGDNIAGFIDISAGDVLITGTNSNGLSSLLASVVDVGASSIASIEDFDLGEPSGIVSIGGFIRVSTTGNIILSDSGKIDTRTLGDGPAGAIAVLAEGSIVLDDGAQITTESRSGNNPAGLVLASAEDFYIVRDNSQISAITRSGDGGNLFLVGSQGIILFDGSQITTEAGEEQNGGDGGNIVATLNLGVLSFPIFDSNISAEAFEGDGGSITIFGSYILEGIAEREESPSTNDITASSEFGADGLVTTNELDFEPVRNIVEIPALLIDPDRLIAQACPGPGGATDEIGEFYITGRGGIPAGLNDSTLSDRVIVDWITIDEDEPDAVDIEVESPPDSSAAPRDSIPQTADPTVEAERLLRDSNGDVLLVASTSAQTKSPDLYSGCPASAE